MKIVRIIGGLGNQMFQYALFTALKDKFPDEEILLDYSLMSSYGVHNGLELDRVFGIDLPQASFMQLLKVTRPVYNYKLARLIEKTLPNRKSELLEAKDYTFRDEVFTHGDRYYLGYWQNYKYFIDSREAIQNVFNFQLKPNKATSDILERLHADTNSISVHVRRGDYLKAPNYAGLCGIDYYRQAISHMRKSVAKPTFYLLSDDIPWCIENIVPLFGESPYVVIDFNRGSDSPLDMQIMSSCHHNIIANSSFSWWGAFLNRHGDQIVCAPKKWTNTKVNCKFQLPEWELF